MHEYKIRFGGLDIATIRTTEPLRLEAPTAYGGGDVEITLHDGTLIAEGDTTMASENDLRIQKFMSRVKGFGPMRRGW